MKGRSLSLVMVIVLLMSFVTMAFTPMGQGDDPVLTEGQLMLVGLVASALTWILKLIVSRGYTPKKEHVAIGLYIVSFFVAIAFTPLTFPSFPACTDAPTCVNSFITWIGLLLALAAPVVGIAFLIYNVLLKRVLESMFPAAKG